MGNHSHHYERYTWYSTDKEGPVLTMEPDTHTGVVANYYFPRKVPTGVKEVSADDLLVLYPNPATDQLFIQFKNTPAQPVQLVILNMLGQAVLTQALSGQDNMINISGLAKGIYGYKVDDQDGLQFAASFIKQ